MFVKRSVLLSSAAEKEYFSVRRDGFGRKIGRILCRGDGSGYAGAEILLFPLSGRKINAVFVLRRERIFRGTSATRFRFSCGKRYGKAAETLATAWRLVAR